MPTAAHGSWRRAGRALALTGLLVATSCGRTDIEQSTEPVPAPAASRPAPTTGATPTAERGVPPSDVEIVGSLTTEQDELVTWALGRFERAGLMLPERIEVSFDTSPAACGWTTGRCRPDRDPPLVRVCASSFETYAQLLQQRTTLLHELAHVWHWARGDGENWFDLSDIVGGCCCCGGVTSHEERTEERVAIVIEWGLLDQLRRPVRLDVTCAQLHEQFVALTRHAPLGPIEPVCLPG